MKDINLFIKRLSELIAESGKTQNTISEELGVTKQRLSKWKTGYSEPSLDDIIAIAYYFGVSSDYLLGMEDEYGTKTDLRKK